MKYEILNYIKQNDSIEVPALQNQFNLSYKEVKTVIDELTANGTLIFESGVKYRSINKPVNTLVEGKQRNNSFTKLHAERLSYLEARRQELLRRMQAETNKENDDEAEEDAEDTVSVLDRIDKRIDDDELCVKALQLCIEKNQASVFLLRRSFPIGYIRACQLVDWMESRGYISASDGPDPRKVLISQEEFDKLFVKHIETTDETKVSGDDSDNGNDNRERGEGKADLRSALVACLERGLKDKSEDEKYILGLDGELKFELKFVNDGNAFRLSDGGKTLASSSQTDRKIKNVLKRYAPVVLEGREICITIENPSGTLMALLTLYSAIDAVEKMR